MKPTFVVVFDQLNAGTTIWATGSTALSWKDGSWAQEMGSSVLRGMVTYGYGNGTVYTYRYVLSCYKLSIYVIYCNYNISTAQGGGGSFQR